MALEFKPFDSHIDLPKQRDLFRSSFPENIGTSSETEEHYRWKFRRFPSEIPSYEFAAYEDNAMVGYYAALPYTYVLGDRRYTAGMVCDVMTHPDMRGRGVFAKLGSYATDSLAREGLSFTTGYPIRPEVIPGHLKVGWKIMFRLPMYMYFLRSNRALKTKRLGFLAPVVNLALWVYHFFLRPSSDLEYDYTVLTRDELLNSDAYDEFLRKWTASQRFALVKSREFLRWRTGAPSTEYHFISSSKHGKITGLALVRRTVLQDIPCLAVLDWMTLAGHESAVGGITKSMRDMAQELRCEALVTMMSPTLAGKYRLVPQGFLRTPFVFSLIIKRLDESIDEHLLADETNWHLMWIDSDDL